MGLPPPTPTSSDVFSVCDSSEARHAARFICVDYFERQALAPAAVLIRLYTTTFNIMKIHQFLLLAALSLYCGCASPGGIQDRAGRIKPGDSSKISVGMAKLDVMMALGKPESVAAKSGQEILYYRMERPWWQDKPFKIELTDGKVVSFGVIEPDK